MENLKNHCIYCSTDNFLNIENIGVRKTPFSLKYKKNNFFQNFTLFYISSDTEICWRSDRIRNTALSLPRGVSPYFLFAVCVCLLQEAIMRVAKLPHGEDKDPPLPREWPLASLITGKLKRTREGGGSSWTEAASYWFYILQIWCPNLDQDFTREIAWKPLRSERYDSPLQRLGSCDLLHW